MTNVKTSKITGISPSGIWNNMQKYAVSLANGENYTFFAPMNKEWEKVGDTISYSVTNAEKQTAKIIREQATPRPMNANSNNGRVSDLDRQVSIERQCSIKSAVELNASNGNIDNVLRDAEVIYNWIRNR